jgi:hypothetical protein
MNENVLNEVQDLTPKKIAFVIDGKVIDILHTDERLAAIFLSSPTILDVTDWHSSIENTNKSLVNATYNSENNSFDIFNDPMPRPYPSWTLKEDGSMWLPPVPYPINGKQYQWNEDLLNWEEI